MQIPKRSPFEKLSPALRRTQAIAVLVAGVSLGVYALFFRAERYEILGYYWPKKWHSRESLIGLRKELSVLASSGFYLGERLDLIQAPDQLALDFAQRQGIPTLAVFSDQGASAQAVARFLDSPSSQRSIAEALRHTAEERSLRGWQIDFPTVPSEKREQFTAFCRQTAEVLRRAGYSFSVGIPFPTSDNSAFDIRALVEFSDFLSLQTYSRIAAASGSPGPGLQPLRQALAALIANKVPPEKLSLGVPTFSLYRQGPGPIEQLAYPQTQKIIDENKLNPVWNPEAGVSLGEFSRGRSVSSVWLEDARSLYAKVDLIQEFRLRGISLFRLGAEDPRIQDVLFTLRESRR